MRTQLPCQGSYTEEWPMLWVFQRFYTCGSNILVEVLWQSDLFPERSSKEIHSRVIIHPCRDNSHNRVKRFNRLLSLPFSLTVSPDSHEDPELCSCAGSGFISNVQLAGSRRSDLYSFPTRPLRRTKILTWKKTIVMIVRNRDLSRLIGNTKDVIYC
jgi:hypothetical protein